MGDGRDPRRSSCCAITARTLHRKALALALPIACLTALVQPLSGDRSAKHLAVAQPLKLAAAEAHLHTGAARGAAHRRRSRSRDGRVPRRDSDPGRPVVPRVRRPRRDGHRAGGVPARRLAAGAWRVRTAFQVMVGAGSAMALAAIAVIVAAARRRRWPDGRRWLLAFVVLGPARLRQPRGRLAGDRVGAAAVDRARADAHRGRGDGLSLQGGAVLAVHDRLPVPRCRRRLPAGASRSPRADRPHEAGPRVRAWRLTCWLAGTIGVGALPLLPVRRRGLRRRRLGSAGERPARGGAATRDRRRDRPGVGGEPRLADPGDRRAVQRISAGVRGDLGGAARSADAVPGRRRAARLGVRVPLARHVGRSRPAPLRPGVLDGEHDRPGAAGHRSWARWCPATSACRAASVTSGFFAAWLAPFPLAVGVFALALCALLAATLPDGRDARPGAARGLSPARAGRGGRRRRRRAGRVPARRRGRAARARRAGDAPLELAVPRADRRGRGHGDRGARDATLSTGARRRRRADGLDPRSAGRWPSIPIWSCPT